MLKPRYLELTPQQRADLRLAAELLVNMTKDEVIKVPNDGLFRFNMNVVLDKTSDVHRSRYTGVGTQECGTAGCILGLVDLIAITDGRPDTWAVPGDLDRDTGTRPMVRPHEGRVSPDHPCYKLFYPGWNTSCNKVEPKTAAVAITKYLTGDDRPDFVTIQEELNLPSCNEL